MAKDIWAFNSSVIGDISCRRENLGQKWLSIIVSSVGYPEYNFQDEKGHILQAPAHLQLNWLLWHKITN